MTSLFDHLPNRRAIVDRRALAERIGQIDADGAALRGAVAGVLKDALVAGRAEIDRRLIAHPSRGLEAANAGAYLMDQLIGVLFDAVVERLVPLANPTTGERLTLIAVGGYGRAEMAPHSDVDIGFLTPGRQTAWAEQVIESILYTLWDMGLKVGHSSRGLAEMVRQAKADVTIRTALLEARFICGDQALYDEAATRFENEVQKGTEREFVADKLAERDARHVKMGDSRYVVEPNVKEGKGGMRDLHALFWIGKYVYGVQRAAELVEVGLFTEEEYRQFHRADSWLIAVRCHLHIDYRARRGSADVRRTARDRRADAVFGPTGQIRGRALHAILLPAGEGGGGPDGGVPRASRRAVRGARQPIWPADDPATAGQASWFRARPRTTGAAPRRFLRTGPGAADRDVPARRSPPAGNPPARDARGGTRCEADRRVSQGRERKRAVPRHPQLAPRPRAGAAVDERGGGVRPLRARFRPCRRADAVRHVPSLYRRRAHDPRDRTARADRAWRPQGGSSDRNRDHPRYRLAPGAVRRGAAPRHRQGARRGSFGPGRGGGEEAVPAARAVRGGNRDGRVAGPVAPADVRHRVQARPQRFQDDPGFHRCRAKPRTVASPACC